MRSDFSIFRRTVFFILALLWPATDVLAGVSHETLERLAEIQVETYHIDHLTEIGKLTPDERIARRKALQAEEAALWKSLPQTTHAEAESAIQGLSKAKLALLEPQWDKELTAFRKAAEEKNRQTARDLEADAHRAAAFQRERLALQQQLDKGVIDRDTFTAKDRAAVAAIGDLRKKYDTSPTRRWTSQFDSRLETLTRSITEHPATTAPKPHVTTGQGRPAPPPAIQHPARNTSFSAWLSSLWARFSLELFFVYAMWGLAALAIVAVIIQGAFGEKQPPADQAPPLTDTYGSAAWAKHQYAPDDFRLVARGVFLGKSSHPTLASASPGCPIVTRPEAHTLIVAQTGAGKGTRVCIPTLLRYSAGSILTIDPKGENAAITARTRRDQLKQEVHIVNPWGELQDVYARLGFQTATFNPLDAIDRNDPNAVSVAQTLAATICPVTSEKDRFWQGSAGQILSAVFLWITDQPQEKKTLGRARELITQSREDFKKNTLARMMVSSAFHGAIKELISPYYDLAPETYSGIISNLGEATKFLSDPQIKASTATSSFSMEKIRDDYTTVYIVIPHDRIETHATWLRLVIASAMQALKKRTRIKTPPHHRCMFLIDEFGSIGHIADIPRDIALMRGFGLDFTLVIQGLDQLKHHYGEAKGTILNNCAVKWFCHISDLETAKYISESLGKATVRTIGKSKSTGTNPEGGQTEGESTSYGETGRPLLTPEEILTLGRDVAIVLNPGLPHYVRPVDYWKLMDTFSYLKGQHPQFYWMPDLAYDPNPHYQKKEPPPKTEPMSDKRAREILEVSPAATKAEIKAAYTRLMKQVHPDVGGSNFFASQLNAAKAFLLGD